MKHEDNPHQGYDYADVVQAERFELIFGSDLDFGHAGEQKEHLMRVFTNAPPFAADMIMSRSCCLLGASGCGKTNALACILEELARSGVSFSAFDVEGDLSTIADLADLNVKEYEIKKNQNEKEIANLAVDAILGQERRIYVFGADVGFDAIEFFVWQYTKTIRGALEKLKRRQRKYAPHFIVLDEAHTFIAQKPRKDSRFSAQLVFEFGQVSKRGRKYGLGLLIASQRAQDIILSVLSNMQVRFLMRVTEPADKDRYKATLTSVKNRDILWDIIQYVPSLKNGDAIFVPESNEATLVHFRQRDSMHLSKTPGVDDYSDLTDVKKEDLL